MDPDRRSIIDSVSRWGSFLTPIGVLILLILQSQFVSRKDFTSITEKLDSRIMTVEIALVKLIEQNKVNDRQEVELADHETRLRALERVR